MVLPPPIPSKVNRPPAGRYRTKPPRSLARSYPTLPSLRQWRADTKAGRVGSRANEPLMRTIDELIEGLEYAVGGAELYLLGQLFFTTMAWVNNYGISTETPYVDQQLADRKAFLSLNLYAARELARILHCTLGNLAPRLQGIYGVEMSPHGLNLDTTERRQEYLSVARREIYRVFIDRQRAHLFYRNAFRLIHQTAGWGCVLSMSNKLYAYKLGSFPVTFHSFFMGGRPVQCAGHIWFNQGRVTKIKNSSGHYKPVDTSLVKLLNYLRMNGIDPSTITVETIPFVEQGGQVVADERNPSRVKGDVFLRDNGNWNAILKRARHQGLP